jgi:hypothetical protein
VTAAERFLTLEQLRALADAAGEHRPWCTSAGHADSGSEKLPNYGGGISTLKTNPISRSVTLVDGELVVGSPKNGKGRTVSLPAFVTHLLIAGEPTRWCSLTRRVGTCAARMCVGGGGQMRSQRPSCSRAR